jgi:glycine betaine/choline ABC-type transport system substrate-binding protein
MQHIKEILKKQIGLITNEAFQFALEQCEANRKQIQVHKKEFTEKEILAHVSAGISFYKKHMEGKP